MSAKLALSLSVLVLWLCSARSARAEECDGTAGCKFTCTVTETWTHPVAGPQTTTTTATVETNQPSEFAGAKATFERTAASFDGKFQVASKRFDACKSRESPCSAEAFISALEAHTSREANLDCAKVVAKVMERVATRAPVAKN